MPSCAICWESGGGDPILCENTPWVNKINGLYWAFVSVCAGHGNCGRISIPLPWEWRFATTEEWNAFLAVWDKTQWAADEKCAAPYFPDDYVAVEWIRDTCLYGDHNKPWITNVENNSNNDLFLVHNDVVCPP